MCIGATSGKDQLSLGLAEHARGPQLVVNDVGFLSRFPEFSHRLVHSGGCFRLTIVFLALMPRRWL
jgi:hypothetical protein